MDCFNDYEPLPRCNIKEDKPLNEDQWKLLGQLMSPDEKAMMLGIELMESQKIQIPGLVIRFMGEAHYLKPGQFAKIEEVVDFSMDVCPARREQVEFKIEYPGKNWKVVGVSPVARFIFGGTLFKCHNYGGAGYVDNTEGKGREKTIIPFILELIPEYK